MNTDKRGATLLYQGWGWLFVVHSWRSLDNSLRNTQNVPAVAGFSSGSNSVCIVSLIIMEEN